MTETWRCFVAVPLDETLRAALSEAVATWRREPPANQLRWAGPDGWHLTLAFLGATPPDAVPAISGVINGIAASHRPFGVQTAWLGAFHRPGSVRTLWHGVDDRSGALSALAGDLAHALGLALEEPYRPHVTLARARQRPIDLRGWIEPASLQAPSGHLDVAEIRLLRSHLGRGPARYETLATFALGASS